MEDKYSQYSLNDVEKELLSDYYDTLGSPVHEHVYDTERTNLVRYIRENDEHNFFKYFISHCTMVDHGYDIMKILLDDKIINPDEALEIILESGDIDIIYLLLEHNAAPGYVFSREHKSIKYLDLIKFLDKKDIKLNRKWALIILENFIRTNMINEIAVIDDHINIGIVPLDLLKIAVRKDYTNMFITLIDYFKFDFEKDDGCIIRYAMKNCKFPTVHAILQKEHVDILTKDEMKQIIGNLLPEILYSNKY